MDNIEKTFEEYDGHLKVTETKTTIEEKSYDLDFLNEQKIAIQAQKDNEIAKRDKELAEVEELILEAKKFNI